MDPDLIRVEEKITFLEKTVTELNGVVYEQQKQLDQLNLSLRRLTEQIEGTEAGELPFLKPPHH